MKKIIVLLIALMLMSSSMAEGVLVTYTGPQGEKPITVDAEGNFVLEGLEPHNANTRSRYIYIHGTADTFVPCAMSQAGYDCCKSDREIHLVEGAGHGRSYLYEPEKLTQSLVDFFNRNLSDEYILEEST